MRALRAWVVRLRGVLTPARRDREFDAELESHLQLHIDDNIQAGMTPVEARRQALIKLGGIEPARQTQRERRGIPLLELLLQDLRGGIRALRSGTSWTAIVMLALAIGLTTAMFAIVDALILRPVPFRDADRLAQIAMFDQHGTRPTRWPVVDAWKRSGRFEAVESVTYGTALVGTDVGPIVSTSAFVTAGMFDLLGVKPVRGRAFNPDEAGAQGSGVIISADLWRRAFNGDPGIIGRAIPFDRGAQVVIGVMPAGFRFPEWDTEVWQPLDHEVKTRVTWPTTYARFSTALPRADVLKAVEEIAHQADATTNGQYVRPSVIAGWSNSQYSERALPLLAGGVMLVFVTLCANAGGLLLARFNTRRRQFALCAALGASRRRLMTQAFVESAVLGTAGAAIGVGLASQLVVAARRLLPPAFLERSLHPLALDMTVLVVAAGLAVLATLPVGLLPAWVATRLDVNGLLRLVERGGTETRAARLLTRAFIVTQVGFGCTLLVGTGLLVRSFLNLASIDRGFDSRNLTIAQVSVDNKLVPEPNARRAVFTQITEVLERLPGVIQVAWSHGAPTANAGLQFGSDWLPDMPGASPIRLEVNALYVSGDFFRLYGIEVLRGRAVEHADGPGGGVVVDERMAAALWPGLEAVGRSFTWGKTRLEVVGVARTTRRLVMDRDRDYPTLYWAFEPEDARSATASLRCAATCPSDGAIRKQLLSVGQAVRVSAVKNIDAAYDADLAEPRLTASVAIVFAVIAVLAAAGGLFSILSHAVGRRRREFGIRSALGASTRAIGALVLREGVAVALVGLAIGSVGAWFLARALASVQYGVTVSDPISWAAVVGVLALTTLVAAWRPTRAAMRVNPVELLKEE